VRQSDNHDPRSQKGNPKQKIEKCSTHLIRLVLLDINQRLLGPLLSKLDTELFEFLLRFFGCQGDVLRKGISLWSRYKGGAEGPMGREGSRDRDRMTIEWSIDGKITNKISMTPSNASH
jgi:hypothetical protein